MSHTKEQIVAIACDKCLHQCFPRHTNAPDLRGLPGAKLAFRVPDDGEPFGFSFSGAPIEVHVKMVSKSKTIAGTKIVREVAMLDIYGVLKDGRLTPIALNVNTTERIF